MNKPVNPPKECYILGHRLFGLFLGFQNGTIMWSVKNPDYGHGVIPALPTIDHCNHWIHQSGYPVDDFTLHEMRWRGDNMFNVVEFLATHPCEDSRRWTERMFYNHVDVWHDTVQ